MNRRKEAKREGNIWLAPFTRTACCQPQSSADMSLFFKQPTTLFPLSFFSFSFFHFLFLSMPNMRKLSLTIGQGHLSSSRPLSYLWYYMYFDCLIHTSSLFVDQASLFLNIPFFYVLFWLFDLLPVFVWYEIDGKHYITLHYITSTCGKRGGGEEGHEISFSRWEMDWDWLFFFFLI